MLKQNFIRMTAFFMVVLVFTTMFSISGLAADNGDLQEDTWGNYPQHPTTNDTAYSWSGVNAAFTPTLTLATAKANAAKRTFTIDSDTNATKKKYIILDKDAAGNYLIVEGQSRQTYNLGNGGSIYLEEVNQQDGLTHTWRFDHANPKSLAYWLDNTYRNDPTQMPTALKEHLVSFDWAVEGDYPVYNSGVAPTPAMEALAEKIRTNNPAYTTNGYVSIMSATEYQTYAHLMGDMGLTLDNVGSYIGVFTRSPMSRVTGDTVYNNWVRDIYYNKVNDTATDAQRTFVWGQIGVNNYYKTLPVFWVDNDFFSEVIINWDDNAELVKEVLKEQGIDRLLEAGYSREFVYGLFDMEVPWYGRYPKHPTMNDKAYWLANNEKLSPNVTIKQATEGSTSRLFTIDDEKFILLDKDEETGNYFVMSTRAIVSGAQGYDYTPAHNLSYAGYGGTAPNTTANGEDTWYFNHDNESSLAYWLDNTLLNNPAYIPEELKPHIVEFDWAVEGDYPWLASGTDAINAIADEIIANSMPYTTRGKISVMSATEFKTYADVIGAIDISPQNADGWLGTFLRTPRTFVKSTVTDDVETVTLTNYFAGAVWRLPDGTEYTEANKLEKGYWVGGVGYTNANNQPKHPVFWVDGDFFKNVKLTLIGESDTGEKVVNEMKALGYSTLSQMYSDEELAKLGYEPEKMPVAENPVIIMAPYECALVRCSYDYSSPIDATESRSEIVWYVSNNFDGEYTEFARSNDASVVIPDGYAGKYIKATVTAGDEDGRLGKTATNCVPVKVMAEADVFVSGIEFSSGTANLTIKNYSGEAQRIKALISVYNSDGRLTNINTTDIEIQGNIITKPMSLNGGASYMIMVWTQDNKPIFYVKK